MTKQISNQHSNTIELSPAKDIFSAAMGFYVGVKTFDLLTEDMNLFNRPYLIPVDLFFMFNIALPLSVIACKVTTNMTQNVLDQTYNVVPFIKKTLLAAANALPAESIATDLKPEENAVKA